MEQLRTNRTALIVDDDPMTLVLVSAVLRENSFNVVEGSNGIEAISKYLTTRPSLIVIDLNMPVMDGCSAANIIRNIQGGNECTIVLFTSELQKDIVRHYSCSSVNHVINKKNVDELRDFIAKC